MQKLTWCKIVIHDQLFRGTAGNPGANVYLVLHHIDFFKKSIQKAVRWENAYFDQLLNGKRKLCIWYY